MSDFHEAWLAALHEMPEILRSSTAEVVMKSGGKYSYKYAELPTIIEQVRAVLAKHGLAVAQSVEGDASTIAVTTRIYHTSGHIETFGPLVLRAGATPQESGSAITYARRYALCAALGISPGDDDDGKLASTPPKAAPKPAASPSPSQWLKDKAGDFPDWTPTERREAYETALTSMAITKLDNMTTAELVYDHMVNAYNQRQL